jgi:hypothetical protein
LGGPGPHAAERGYQDAWPEVWQVVADILAEELAARTGLAEELAATLGPDGFRRLTCWP